jgi:sulfite exporter TauE/SafE/copper chaperone CopZ
MHCPSCDIYIEQKLKNLKSISNLKANYKDQTISFDTSEDENKLINEINNLIEEAGYTAQADFPKTKIDKRTLLKSFLIATILLFLFFLIQRSKIFSSVNIPDNIFLMSFIIGIIASLSSCMAVVGSIIISISTQQKGKRSLISFHISRIVAFFILGGLLGLVGNIFTFSRNFYTVSTLIISILLLLMGLNLLDIFPFIKRLIPSFSKNVFTKNFNQSASPVLLGIITFILPCGFTQSMQVIALTSGSIMEASLIMLIFALGTFPILALLSFGILSAKEKINTELLFKTSGFVIIFFAIYTFITLLISLGIINLVI